MWVCPPPCPCVGVFPSLFLTEWCSSSLPGDQCSLVNQKFWKSLCFHLRTLAPTTLSLPDPSHLLHRLRASVQLREVMSLVGFEDSVVCTEWTCAAVSAGESDSVTVFLWPWRFFFQACGDVVSGKRSAVLPILLLHTTQTHILHPGDASPQQADVYLSFDLQRSPRVLDEVAPVVRGLLTQLLSLHTSCYLELLQSSLAEQLPLCSHDYLAGLEVCHSTPLSVDVTPLLAALCTHCLTSFQPEEGVSSFHDQPPQPEEGVSKLPDVSTLCQLLSSALSRLAWTCSVKQKVEGREDFNTSPHCSLYTNQLNEAFRHHLEGVGFRPVPHCGPSHYWMDTAV